MKALAALLALLIGTAQAQSIDMTRPPADWPDMDRFIYTVTAEQLRMFCPRAISGCAIPLFRINQCVILLVSNEMATRNHEILHCQGHDHFGESTMRDAWLAFKNAHRAGI